MKRFPIHKTRSSAFLLLSQKQSQIRKHTLGPKKNKLKLENAFSLFQKYFISHLFTVKQKLIISAPTNPPIPATQNLSFNEEASA
ncbi:hypothetical protein EFB08_08025 [Rufibacter latericius]|uniref:Uncharacterized protein n=1 Tax=Rufibacter latericius TaxID=2487040 RepID=A0A3M9MV13_9BACT|nr:hypothetical protein EFB08_08025 [Rufibacter latericius]